MHGHQPILFRETVAFLTQKEPGDYLDCTFGGGGHACAILEHNVGNRLVALDRDPDAQVRAKAVEADFGDRFRFYSLNFDCLDTIEESGFTGILMDLGLSSFQLDAGERGFSFREDAAVDMRMDPRKGIPASEFLETATREELVEAVRDFGEERKWRRVVDAIMEARDTGVLERTQSFAELVANVVGIDFKKKKRIHPATLTFQGVRMAVNTELASLREALPKAFNKLVIGGVLAVISFHSLEDRIVKRFMRVMAGRPEHSRDNRYADERIRYGELITRRPVIPTEAEIEENPRSRSAKLRVLKKEIDIQ